MSHFVLNPHSENILKLISLLSPILVVFFIVMSSLFNENIKGIVYLSGLCITMLINYFLMFQVGSKVQDEHLQKICYLLNIGLTPYDSPYQSSVILAFTAAYLIIPMIYNSQINYIVLSFFMFIFGVDTFYKITQKCTTISGALLGGLLGIFLAILWVLLFYISGYQSLLFFSDFQSNRVLCSKPSKQTFKCSVFKNGKLISNNIV